MYSDNNNIKTQIMTSEFIPAVWKGIDEKGNTVWHTYDPREGDTFYSKTKREAMKLWNSLFYIITPEEKENMWMNKF